jgi:hypothetical protein
MQLVEQELLFLAACENPEAEAAKASSKNFEQDTQNQQDQQSRLHKVQKQLQGEEQLSDENKHLLEKFARPYLMTVWFNAWWVSWLCISISEQLGPLGMSRSPFRI